MNLTNAERETHFNIVADNRGEVEVSTDDPVWRRKLDKYFTPVEELGFGGARYIIPTKAFIRMQALKSTRGSSSEAVELDPGGTSGEDNLRTLPMASILGRGTPGESESYSIPD